VDKLPLTSVIETFDSLGLRGHNDRLLDVSDMTSTLNTLFNICLNSGSSGTLNPSSKHQQQSSSVIEENSVNIDFVTDMALNWLLNVYDPQRTGQVRNLSFKIGVVLLAKGPMEDKFRCE